MKKLNIIYEDKELLVVSKPTKQLTISTTKDSINTLYHEAREYEKKKNPKNKIFIVHRLDRDTSGIVMFVKNEQLKHSFQNNWNELAKKREYIAVVEGNVTPKKDKIKSYLTESKTLQVYSTKDKTNGKIAITEYEVLQNNRAYSLLKINIKTGRRNQIRVHMNDINHPIIGDKKYDSKRNPLGRLGLHASRLEIIHPKTKKLLVFTSPYPKQFDEATKPIEK